MPQFKKNKNKKLKKPTVIKYIVIICVTFLSLLGITASASTSTSFKLDYDTIHTGAEKNSSGNFIIHSGPTNIQSNSSSANFQTATINYFDICGNGVLELNEACDGSNFGAKTCSDFGFSSGTLSCAANCGSIVTSACSNASGGGGSSSGGSVTQPSPPIFDFGPDLDDYDFSLIPESPEIFPDSEGEKPIDLIIDEPEIKEIEIPKIAQKPSYIPTIKPTLPSPYKYHFYSYELGSAITTVDLNPLIADQLEKEAEYKIIIYDEKGKITEESDIITDKNGNFVYETKNTYELGTYRAIVQKNKKTEQKYSIIIVNDKYKKIRITDFNNIKNPISEPGPIIIDIGTIYINSEMKIKGETEAFTKIFAYFNSDYTHIVETQSDENGKFEIAIPADLCLGEHTVYIVQTFPDLTVSKSIKYRFILQNPPEPKISSTSVQNSVTKSVTKLENKKAETIIRSQTSVSQTSQQEANFNQMKYNFLTKIILFCSVFFLMIFFVLIINWKKNRRKKKRK